jgi:4-hydroxy-tetrahydrodipicolinate reductase
MNKPISIALVGAAGRMGGEIARLVGTKDDPTIRITGAIEHEGAPSVGQDLGQTAGTDPFGVPITSDLLSAFQRAQVAIDLSLPTATKNVIDAARKTQTALVCGTTGLTEQELRLFDSAAQDIPVLHTPNLSLGVAVLKALVEQAVESLGPDFDIEIVEMHHRDKLDAPSGTALAIGEAAALAAGLDPAQVFKLGRSGHTGKRSSKEIGIHAVRGGGVFGHHKIILSSRHENIEISHSAVSRTLFAEGALRAARFLCGKKPGRYTMADMLI